jgi:hypothetical protein
MAVIVNKNTTQTPLAAAGVTGTQSIKHVPASRVYIKAPDSTTSAPVQSNYVKSNGATPSAGGSYIDLGIMTSAGKITYTKNKKKVTTGIDEIVRAVYVDNKSAEIEFNLMQMDDYLLSQLGFTASTIVNGSIINFQLGPEDIVSKALLLVYQNKLDGKEIQWYHPAAQLAVTFEEQNDGIEIKVVADCIGFTPQGAAVDSLLSCTVFA